MGLPLSRPRAAVCVGRGPRECESRLLADLAPLVGADLGAAPVLVIVPSRSLALHLQARLVEHFGRPVLGVRCTTLWGLAVGILEAAGEPPPPRLDLFPLLARRHARAEPLLVADLGELLDGYGALLGSARDLLDAGLEEAHLPALEDALAAPPRGTTRHEIERALAVARVAGATARDLAALGGGRRADLLRRATEVVQAGSLPSCRALLVAGFADATGIAGDLLVALLAALGGTLHLDEPPDPLAPDRADAGAVFSERFRQRLALAAAFGPATAAPSGPPELAMFTALGSEAEVREVARRARALLDGGTRPVAIGVTARHLTLYSSPLRSQLARLGVPFSGLAATGPPGPDGRRARAFLELLRLRSRTSIDRWLEACLAPPWDAPPDRLRGGLFARGIGRLEDVPLAAPSAREPTENARRHRRRRDPVAEAALPTAAAIAGEICARLEAWPTATAADHAARLDSLLGDLLGWEARFAPRQALALALADLPPGFTLEFDELVELLAPTLEGHGLDPLGGAGGGVQVLDVIEARSRTFEHLFVLGLNRGVFPRLVLEDPMLPDGVRLALGARGAGVLPDLVEKRAGFDEERFLFAQLLAASPRVTLSWQETDDDNLPLAVSPLVARLVGSAATPAPLAPVRQSVLEPRRGPLTAAEGAIVAGLARDRDGLAAVLALALADGAPPAAATEALARARVELLDELDPLRGTPRGERFQAVLGPFFGFVGAPAGEDDPRTTRSPFVTHLERLAECPWRFFLERLLWLAPAPDPLAVLPGVDPRLLGSLVHEVLRAIVEEQIGSPPATLEEACLRVGVSVVWPDAARLDRLLRTRAEALVEEEGLPLPGLARALAAAAAPILKAAREREWEDDRLTGVLAADTEGALTVEDVAGRPRRIGFRADRVDRRGSALRLTDYKTGRVPWRETAIDGRRREMHAAIESGRLLQAAAYALASGRADDEGRYVYLHPAIDEDRPRTATARAADAELAAAFRGVTRTTLEVWDAGAFFPRFLLQDRSAEHPHCERCEVRDACLRGDSGARLRFDDWLGRHLQRPVAPAPGTPAEAALLALWPLGGKE